MMANLTKNIVGAGILGLPFAMQDGGLGLGLINLTFFGGLSLVGFLAIGHTCHATGARTYREAWERTVGVFPAIVDVAVLLECLITGVGYTILALDYTSTGLRGLFGYEGGPHLRAKLAATMTALVLVPLCLRPNLDSLKVTSQVGNFIMLYTILYVILDFGFGEEGGPAAEVASFSGDREGVFRSIVVMTSAYIAHYSAPNFMADLSESSTRPLASFSASALVAFTASLVAYCAFAAAGYLRFGPTGVLGNILLNYEAGHRIMVGWLSMAPMLLLTFPIAFKPARDTVAKALRLREPRGGEACAATAWSAATGLLVVLTVIAGVVFEDISMVLAFRGALLGCPISFVMPGLMLWNCPAGGSVKDPALLKPIAATLIAVGVLAGLLGLYCTCMAL